MCGFIRFTSYLKTLSACAALLGFVLVFFSGLEVQASVVKLTVIKPNAAVYQRPDFDSEVMIVLPQRRQVYGSEKTMVGESGLGLFHKVRLKKGLYGFVLDTDVRNLDPSAKKNETSKKKVQSKPKSAAVTKSKKEPVKAVAKKDQKKSPEKEQRPSGFDISRPQTTGPKNVAPFFFRKYVGLNLGAANYSEKIVEGTKSSTEWLVGLKLTGPNWVLKNFLLDINLNFHLGAPQFFDDFSSDASGFLVQADVTLPFMLKPLKNGAFYGGVGPLVSASSYKFNYLGNQEESTNIRMGGVVMLGLGYEFGGFALRLEPKYYVEKTSYFAFLAGIQKRL